MKDYYKDSLFLHEQLKGKIAITPKINILTNDELSLVYSPGVAEPCRKIAEDAENVWKYTMKGNTVAIVSDGSAILGLGNLGAKAAIPVMEGKALLFKKFANIDAFPICLDTQDTQEIIDTIKIIAPVFGGINLEDISSPRSFIIEENLQEIGIPVFHDDQHGTAIVALAGLINSCKVVGKNLKDIKVVINGGGAAGIAIAKMLRCVDSDPKVCVPVKELIVLDSKGIFHKGREDLNDHKRSVLQFSNPHNISGGLDEAIRDADVFIGVSAPKILTQDHIKKMNKDAIIFALANPEPEIMPELAYQAGAAIVCTGRSDFPNQVNNVLGFPGIFRGALDTRAKKITFQMKHAAAVAIANCLPEPTKEKVIPATLDMIVAVKVAEAVRKSVTDLT